MAARRRGHFRRRRAAAMTRLLPLFFAALAGLAAADDYYYNLEKWIQPALDQVNIGANNGMDLTEPLGVAPESEERIRAEIQGHLANEMSHLTMEIQSLVNVVKNVGMKSSDSLHEAVDSLTSGEDAEEVGATYVDAVGDHLRNGVQRLAAFIGAAPAEFSPSGLRSASATLRSAAVRAASPEELEKAMLGEMRAAVAALTESQLANSDLLSGSLHALLKAHAQELQGREAEVEAWLAQLTRDALQGATPSMAQLHRYVQQVADDATQFCKDVHANAFQIFGEYKDAMGPSWDAIRAHHA